MAVSKEFVENMAEELGYKFYPFTKQDWIRVEKDGVERKFKSYNGAYNYLYRQRRKQLANKGIFPVQHITIHMEGEVHDEAKFE